jgi:hypothetical protein
MTAELFYSLVIWILASYFLAFAIREGRHRNVSGRAWWFWAAGAGGIILYSIWIQRWVGIAVAVLVASGGFLAFQESDRWFAEMRASQQDDDD